MDCDAGIVALDAVPDGNVPKLNDGLGNSTFLSAFELPAALGFAAPQQTHLLCACNKFQYIKILI